MSKQLSILWKSELMHRRSLVSAVGALAALGGLAPQPCSAELNTAVGSGHVLFGQAAALDGPASMLGQRMRDGIVAAFAEANRLGGVRGRRLDLLSFDDGYEPARSVEVTRCLIEEHQVFGLVGPVGTPTCLATQPIATAAGVPFVGALTGAAFLRNPELRNVINLRASYAQEAEVAVAQLIDRLGCSRIAVFSQRDGFGQAGLEGVQQALSRRGQRPVVLGTYERNTTSVRDAVVAIRRGQPDAVMMVAASRPCAEFIRIAHHIQLGAVFTCLSFVGAGALAHELGTLGESVFVTEVVPSPTDESLPVVCRYQDALRAVDADAAPGSASLEGYVVGRLVAGALERVTGTLTREAFLAAFEGSFDIDGLRLVFGPGRNQGSDKVFSTVIQADGIIR